MTLFKVACNMNCAFAHYADVWDAELSIFRAAHKQRCDGLLTFKRKTEAM